MRPAGSAGRFVSMTEILLVRRGFPLQQARNARKKSLVFHGEKQATAVTLSAAAFGR